MEHVRRFGRDAVAFQALQSEMRHWFDTPPPEGTGGCVAFFDTGAAWVAAGGPLAPEADSGRAACRFVEAARVAKRRASFFATERILPGFGAIPLGEQPVFAPSRWLDGPARGRRMREQLRRARAKGVRVRSIGPDALRAGTPLRAEVDALAADWLRGRPMEPMGFLVALELFHVPCEHRYLAAERAGRLIAFLSAVPVPAREGWLVESVVRAPDAPNGTSETLFAALCAEVSGSQIVSLGLAPLSGARPAWARIVAVLGRPLYDFAGLRAFKVRLHPDRWEPVFLLHPRQGGAARPVLDALRAFAGGSLVRFGARSVLAHPAGPPWALAMILTVWTVVLAALTVADTAAIFGFGRVTLTGWVAFDALLALLLFRFARRPRPGALLVATALAVGDAILSIVHLEQAGLPRASWHLMLRLLATAGPVAGALALAWAMLVRIRLRKRAGW